MWAISMWAIGPVFNIDYKAQVIKVYDPDNCLPRKLLKIRNLSSTSPFRFAQDNLSNYTLFNRSKEGEGENSLYYESIPCLSGPGYQIYVAQSNSPIEDLSIDCTKLNNTSPLPYEACGHCEAKGKRCRPKNNATTFEIYCFHFHPKGNIYFLFICSALSSAACF
ncbi:hypothetical protein TorRG33x02_072150 [Trema orientale]|uniref:RING-type E3 ubiquitin transferase n=1 Tax=Trema orientale TaxID=63057 RepID=A0A2P5FGF1_TREOI|nr:hypothetical protein TorRG33x02_072150 [Trema orientale]